MSLTNLKTLDNATWPWRVVQLGPPKAPVFYIFDCNEGEVARFFGRNARENCELVMELRAQLDYQKIEKLYVQPPVKQFV